MSPKLALRSSIACLVQLSVLACHTGTGHPPQALEAPAGAVVLEPMRREQLRALGYGADGLVYRVAPAPPALETERYDFVAEDGFLSPLRHPLSTFSVDVDTASYSNVRRFLNEGRLPPSGAVRIEELVNYFRYDVPPVDGEHPFSVVTETMAAPWAPDHLLVRVGLRGVDIPEEQTPPRNLVFLLDVSGSMQPANKLPLVKRSLRELTLRLRPQDHVAIVVYAGASGLALPPTSGRERGAILERLEQLQAGGSTAGADGIRLAYDVAREHFASDGINRVILATDGDLNVGCDEPVGAGGADRKRA